MVTKLWDHGLKILTVIVDLELGKRTVSIVYDTRTEMASFDWSATTDKSWTDYIGFVNKYKSEKATVLLPWHKFFEKTIAHFNQ